MDGRNLFSLKYSLLLSYLLLSTELFGHNTNENEFETVISYNSIFKEINHELNNYNFSQKLAKTESYNNHLTKTEFQKFDYLPFLYSPILLNVPKQNNDIRLFNQDIMTKKNSCFKNQLNNSQKHFSFSLSPKHTNMDAENEKIKDSKIILDPSFRFENSVFAWENHSSLKESLLQNELIPFDLLDAISRSNFEMFFLQQKQHPNDHNVFLKTLHGANLNITRASTLRLSEMATYLFLIAIIIAFVKKHLTNTK